MSDGPKDLKKVVLAYSGGLDTSVILRWLQETYRCEVVTFTADLGQGEELEPARKKAELMGVKRDLHRRSARGVRRAISSSRCSAPTRSTRAQYLLGTSIARPLIAKRQIEIARQVGADAVAHGATGKGNDQVRFELAYYALEARHQGHRAVARMGPDLAHPAARIRREAPDPDRHATSAARRRSRSTPTCCTSRPRARCWRTRGSSPRNTSISRTVAPEKAPDKPQYVEIDFAPRRPGRGRRRGAVAGGAADAAQRTGRRGTASAGSIWSRTASSA